VAPVRARPVSGWEALTPAELEVVRLAADGLTNRQIGSRLFVSHRTVATHLSHVFDKLSVRSRVALAREAAQRFGAAEANG
jgi:DNA-binding CsgD family transcriptional regulator